MNVTSQKQATNRLVEMSGIPTRTRCRTRFGQELGMLCLGAVLTGFASVNAEAFGKYGAPKCPPTPPGMNVLANLRDCTVWIRNPRPGHNSRPTLDVTWEAYALNDSTVNYIYVQGPFGELMDQVYIGYDNPGGTRRYPLHHGPGDYQVVFPGVFSRKGAVSTPAHVPIMIEPAKGHACMLAMGGTHTFFFRVPSRTDSFTLCGKNFNGPNAIRLYTPGGVLHKTLNTVFDATPLHFERLAVDNPEAGTWRIEFSGWGNMAFWVDGVPNLFAAASANLFVPRYDCGITVAKGCGKTAPRGRIGANLTDCRQEPVAEAALAYLNMESYHYSVMHELREPFNPAFPNGGDNDDPNVVDWTRFSMDEDRIAHFHDTLGAEISSLFNSEDSWLGIPTNAAQQAEFAEFAHTYVYYHNEIRQRAMGPFSLWHEPNLADFTFEQYERMLVATAARLKDPATSPAVRDTPLLAINSSGFENSNKGPGRIGMLWAEDLYRAHDDIVDGIAFNYWDCRDLVESWRFGNAVNIAAGIIAANDSDGDTDEEVVINMGSPSAGSGSSPYDVNTHHSALWIAGAVCRAIGTGKLDAFHYFTTFDDDRHMKGMIYGYTPPPALPYQDQAVPFEVKPGGHAMAMLTGTLLDEVLLTTDQGVDVSTLLTVDAAHRNLGAVIVNSARRPYALLVTSLMPPEMRHQRYEVTVTRFSPDMKTPETNPRTYTLRLNFFFCEWFYLEPESVYAFAIRRRAQ